MAKHETSLDDIAESIADLSSMMANEIGGMKSDIGSLRTEMGGLKGEMGSLRSEMASEFAAVRSEMAGGFAKVNSRLDRLEGSQETQEADIKALYEMVADLQKDVKNLSKDERRRLADLETFAMQVAEQTGVPFIRKRSA